VRNGGRYITEVAGYSVESVRDLGIPGYDSTRDNFQPILPTSASSPLLTLHFHNGCVFHLRPSGTEPKFKYYIEMQGKPGVKREVVSHELEIMKAALLEEIFQPAINGLVSSS
jgi:phosphomannomutase